MLEEFPKLETLAAPSEDIRKRLSSLFDSMMKSLFKEKGAEFRVELVADPAVQEFVGAHASVLDSAFEQVGMTDAMRRRLTRSNYIFSGMKAFHELHEAFPSLLDENGNRKSFERFLNDVRSIDATYNENYLRAEYNFVSASAEMAARWESFMKDGDRYNLQYRTQRDDKVRPEHAALDRVTLPMSDSFWEEFYPPNGWNCFVGTTPVLTASGWKFIKDINAGDLVIGGSGKYRTVVSTLAREVDAELVSVCTKGAFATCTKNHRFLTSRGWISANDLNTSDILVQVGKVSTHDKFINTVYNTVTLLKYCLIPLIRKWEAISSPTIDSDIKCGKEKVCDISAKQSPALERHSHCSKMQANHNLGFALGLANGAHPIGMFSAGFKRVGQSLGLGIRTKERRRHLEPIGNSPYKRAVRFVLALSDMIAGLCKRMVGGCKSFAGLYASAGIVSPLSPDCISSMSDGDAAMKENATHGPLVDIPMSGQPSETTLLDKIARFGGIDNPAALNGFNSFYDFLRQTFFHTRYALVSCKGIIKKSKTTVYNLSVEDDESYIVPTGIVHNCRCTVVQVLKSKYPETPHDEAMRLGDAALQRDKKGVFRFNAGKEGKSVPDYNPYTIRKCSTCPIAKGGKSKKLAAFIPDNEVCKACMIFHECAGNAEKSARAIERKHYMREMAPLLGRRYTKSIANGSDIQIGFSTYGNKHLFSDTFGRSSVLSKDDLKNLDTLLAHSVYDGESTLTHPRSDGIELFYYFKAVLRGQEVRLNIAKQVETDPHGRTRTSYFLYSVNDI